MLRGILYCNTVAKIVVAWRQVCIKQSFSTFSSDEAEERVSFVTLRQKANGNEKTDYPELGATGNQNARISKLLFFTFCSAVMFTCTVLKPSNHILYLS